MQLAISIVALLTALTPILLDWWQRRNSPTAYQQAEADIAKINAIYEQITIHEAHGNYAAADALRRMLDDAHGHSDPQ